MTHPLVKLALEEDIGSGDVTADYFVPTGKRARAFVRVRNEGVISGVDLAAEVFLTVDPELRVEVMIEDGAKVGAGALVMSIEGEAKSILSAERSALNFLQRLSGVASMTALYVEAVNHTKVRILDTRKTTPGYRVLEKKAVLDGGGSNNRMGLYDRAMVKDNHLIAEGGIEALQAAIDLLSNEKPGVEVELEADSLDQVKAFLGLRGVDYILLDNMSNIEMAEAVSLRGDQRKPLLEASGGVTLQTLAGIAETGVDFISVGALTHSAPALDIGLDFVE